MPRFLSSAVLCAFSLLCSIAGAQTTATNTKVKGSPSSATYGIAVTVNAGVAPHSAPAANGPAFNTTPFSTYFGANVDPSFTYLQGQLTADLNGDGAPDLLVYQAVNSGTSPKPVMVQSFISNGKGGFTAGTPQELTLPATTSANVGVTPPACDRCEWRWQARPADRHSSGLRQRRWHLSAASGTRISLIRIYRNLRGRCDRRWQTGHRRRESDSPGIPRPGCQHSVTGDGVCQPWRRQLPIARGLHARDRTILGRGNTCLP